MRSTPARRTLPRRSFVAGTAALFGTPLAAACGSDGSDRAGGGGGTLDVWVYEDPSTVVQEEAVKRFNKSSDIKAKLTRVPGDGYENKLRTSMGTGNAPDIFFNWGGGSIQDFVRKDMVLDLTPYLREDSRFKDAFIPSILEAGTVDRKYYGVPMRSVQPVLLFYNKDVFREAGAEPPRSWNDMLDLVDTFKKRDVIPYALGGAEPWTDQMWLEYLLDRYGGHEIFYKVQNGDMSAWGHPAVLKAAQAVEDLVRRGAFGKKYKSVQYTNDAAPTLLAKGRAAMHLMGSWEYANQKAQQPDFAKDGLGWVRFPDLPGGRGDPANVVGNPTNYWSVNAKVADGEQGGKREAAAVEFVKLAAEKEYSRALIDNGDVPPTAHARSLLSEHDNPAYARFQYDLVDKAPYFTVSWNQALPAKQGTPMLTAIEKLFNGQIGPEKFVATLKGL
ncbi:ABC transporter substrate-binding protein [Streptomyces boncukensis]|uniref:Extracellular solute-binding protein n=1 Tax=Streptomyces boncukensis TaxID=2711219 RepID=A0A6G4X232_9ACTN|nr:extracellular solute-binding protein [Streptomyces boncukensis]NGO70804.1 extracellular solute-binding protein [Streptomyces boncukensis]